MRILRGMAMGLALSALAASAWAQAGVTAADLGRLEATAAEIRQQVAALEKTDRTLADDVAKRLVELTEEITYLRVKLRREEPVTRAEYGSLRDRLETLRVRAEGRKVTAQPVLDEPVARVVTVPVGTEIDVRLQTHLNSGTSPVEKRFEATTILDVTIGGDVAVPAGSVVRGFVSSVSAAGKLDRRGRLTLSFDELRIGQRTERMRASIVQALDAKTGEDATRIGVGAAAGAIIGGILGGGKGALLGILVGGGGTMAATEGSDVDLPVGTILRIRLDQPIEIIRDRS